MSGDNVYSYGSWWTVVQSMIPEYGWPRVMELAESGWIKANYPDFDSVGLDFLTRKYHEYNVSLQDQGGGGLGGALKKIGGAVSSIFKGSLSSTLTNLVGNPLGNMAFTTPDSVIGRASLAAGAPMVLPQLTSSLTSSLQSFLPSSVQSWLSSASSSVDQLRSALNVSSYLPPELVNTVNQFRNFASSSQIAASSPQGGNMELLDVLRNMINGGAAAPSTAMVAGPLLGGVASAGRAMLGLGGAVAGVAMGVVRTASGLIRGVITQGGRFVSSRKAVELAKRVGIDAAAVALGVTSVELAQMVLQETSRPRGRGKGITAAQLRTTGRTMRKIETMHKRIHKLARSAVSHR